MPAPENPKVGGCYMWLISFLLFSFTTAGAIFLVLYIAEPTSSSPSWYAVIGVSLVCLPWFFWLLLFLYRIISRSCGFRMICFGPFGSGYPVDNDNASAVPAGPVGNNAASSAAANPVFDATGAGCDTPNDVSGILVSGNRNENENGNREQGSPRRVHFGGVVVIGEDDSSASEDPENPKTLSRISSSSSSSSSSRHSNESELPLTLAMA